MPAPWQRTSKTAPTADTTLVTTAETVVATLSGISTQTPDAPVNLRGWLGIGTGASVTAVVLRIRRTGLTGTLVGEAVTLSAAAATNYSLDIECQDFPGEIAGGVYVLTVSQTGATGNGTAFDAALEAVV